MDAIELKVFLPAKDFERSLEFYRELGFEVKWVEEDRSLAGLAVGSAKFLLQKFYVKEAADNFMMHLLVPDVDAWWQRIQDVKLAEKYSVQVGKPEDRPWGMRDMTVVDPSGVLWRIGQTLKH